MKTTLALAVLSLLVGLSAMARAGSHDRRADRMVRDPLVGAWRLVSLEDRGVDGQPHRCDCTGLFVFTPDGHASVQVMMRETPAAASAGPVQYAQGGYEASFGRYTVDEGAHTFRLRVEGALVRSLVGKDLVRHYELSGARLVVSPVSTEEHWRVTWERP